MIHALKKGLASINTGSLWLYIMLAFTLPAMAQAQPNQVGEGFNADTFKPPENLDTAFQEGGAAWWEVIATGGLWVSLGAAAVLFVFGLTQYIRWAFLAAAIFAFGDDILIGFAKFGGVGTGAAGAGSGG